MIAIADAGSSKTDWAFIDKTDTTYTTTPGIHPFFTKKAQITSYLSDNKVLVINQKNIKSVYFYGAGCTAQDNIGEITESLQEFFQYASIEVYSDILGAARSLLQNEPGIACILGTGTNSCIYDGNIITRCSPSLGYVLGDEGSGAYFGKALLKAYFYNKMPSGLQHKFQQQFETNRNIVLNNVYGKKQPNKYLASFTNFLKENRNEGFINDLIEKGFHDFVKNHLLNLTKIHSENINFTGSVAWHFQQQLKKVVEQHKLSFNQIIQSPIKGITQFHQKQRHQMR